ncbi:MAG: cupin domain-containing protein [Thermodesulfovibrionales bacterium]|nr:cupin domain-containing protein [Thermodesulfovibrionales bacterium]
MAGKTVSFCDIKTTPSKRTPVKTRLLRHKGGFSWQGVSTEKYKPEDATWAYVIRRVLVGGGGERTKFHLRYFELAPGGYTSFERHRHEHVVIGVRGMGKCRAGEKVYNIKFMDTLYICPDEPHQLENPYAGPFGFFCIVDAKRDRPKGVRNPRPKGSATPKIKA